MACKVELVYGHEDEESIMWGDYYVCHNCFARINGGILVAPGEEIPPKFCPKCGTEFTSFEIRHDEESR